MAFRALAWVTAAVMSAASPVFACEGNGVLFQDDFAKADPAWEFWDQTKIEGGAMKITAQPQHVAPIFYKGDSYAKADICVDAIAPNVSDPKNLGLASLLFEGQSYDDFYAFYVNVVDGTAAITRFLKTSGCVPFPFARWTGSSPKRAARTRSASRSTARMLRLMSMATRSSIF